MEPQKNRTAYCLSEMLLEHMELDCDCRDGISRCCKVNHVSINRDSGLALKGDALKPTVQCAPPDANEHETTLRLKSSWTLEAPDNADVM